MFGFGARSKADGRRKDLDAFQESLVGADTPIIDLTSALAMYWADQFETQRVSVYTMEDWLMHRPDYDQDVFKMIRRLNSLGQGEQAVGLIVWLHTAHALTHPECRNAGRLMWAELNKATPVAEVMALQFAADNNRHDIQVSRVRFPTGLGPTGR